MTTKENNTYTYTCKCCNKELKSNHKLKAYDRICDDCKKLPKSITDHPFKFKHTLRFNKETLKPYFENVFESNFAKNFQEAKRPENAKVLKTVGRVTFYDTFLEIDGKIIEYNKIKQVGFRYYPTNLDKVDDVYEFEVYVHLVIEFNNTKFTFEEDIFLDPIYFNKLHVHTFGKKKKISFPDFENDNWAYTIANIINYYAPASKPDEPLNITEGYNKVNQILKEKDRKSKEERDKFFKEQYKKQQRERSKHYRQNNNYSSSSNAEEFKKAQMIFNLRDGYTEEDLNKAYKNLAKEYHPDLNEGDEDKMIIINQYHEILQEGLNYG